MACHSCRWHGPRRFASGRIAIVCCTIIRSEHLPANWDCGGDRELPGCLAPVVTIIRFAVVRLQLHNQSGEMSTGQRRKRTQKHVIVYNVAALQQFG